MTAMSLFGKFILYVLARPFGRGAILCGLLWFLGQTSWACKIQIYPYLYYLNSPQELNSAVFHQHDCPTSVTAKILELLTQQDGIIKTKHLTAALSPGLLALNNVGHIIIAPDQLEIQALGNVLDAHGSLNSTQVITNLRFIDQRRWLGSFRPIEIDLTSLRKDGELVLGEKHFKITYSSSPSSSSLGSSQITWLDGKLQEKQQVLVAQTNIAPGQDLTPEMFTVMEIAVDHPAHYFTLLENLIYFKANKALAKKSILKQQDLTARPLVRPALPVTAIIEQGNLRMKNTAHPRSVGCWGDVISLEVGGQKKIVAGKVIGLNKVLVQL